MIEPAEQTYRGCGGALHRIGEEVAERLDVIPAQFRVIVTRRPKHGCRACESAVVQAPAPARLIEGGLPTEALVAHVLVGKYADHLPLYRQSQIYARQGIELDRSTRADWVGRAAAELTSPAAAPSMPCHPSARGVQGHSPGGPASPSSSTTAGVETESNVVERSIRPIALTRKNALFAGSDQGGLHGGVIASLIETAKLNAVDPQANLADVLSRLVNRHPASQIDQLMPWTYAQAKRVA